MRHLQLLVVVAVIGAWVCGFARAEANPETVAPSAPPILVKDEYPGLASGPLLYAQLADLPAGTLLTCGDITLAEADIEAAGAGAPPALQPQLKKNAFFVLEQVASPRILLDVARQDALSAKRDISAASEQEIIGQFVKAALDSISVSDEEVTAFYNENKSMFGGTALSAFREQLVQYLLEQKRQTAFRSLVESLGQKATIRVSASWTKSQSVLSRDNAVDKARMSGMATMVDFGRDGCGPCDMMEPILEVLKKKYEGKFNVVFIHTGDEEILGMRYGIESIPTQVFFDRQGKEVFRHTGFFPQEEIEKKIAELGVK